MQCNDLLGLGQCKKAPKIQKSEFFFFRGRRLGHRLSKKKYNKNAVLPVFKSAFILKHSEYECRNVGWVMNQKCFNKRSN